MLMPVSGMARVEKGDTIKLPTLHVVGKDKTQRLREGALSVNAVNIAEKANVLNNVADIINRTSGVKVRADGGMGSDFDLTINGLSGNSIRYFIDGVPLDTKGSAIKLSDLPVNLIQRIEIYKGVVPSSLGTDALGGAVNIITRQEQKNYLDASYTIGSYGTHQLNLNGQYVEKHTGLILRPMVAYNYSKNNYTMKEVEVWDEAKREFVKTERDRFHDAYSSFMGQIELGFMNKWWTDAFFVSASYTKTNKELQTGATQSRVIGAAERDSKAWNIAARYQKHSFLLPKLDIKLSASHTWDNSVTTDSARRQYDWNGDYVVTSRNETNGREPFIRHYTRPLTVAMLNLGYTFNEQHQIDFNYSLTRIGNKQSDELIKNFDTTNDALTKHILALTYNQSLFNSRMHNIFFVKEYINHLWTEQSYLSFITNSADMAGASTSNNLGAGVGLRYEFMPQLAVKASYERSIRLPMARELLGNATNVYPNLALKPEESNNWNLGVYGTFNMKNGIHSLSYDINGFIRDVDNYIQPSVSEKEGMIQYGNLAAIKVAGIEAEIRYSWMKRLNVIGNVSWQDARDKKKLKSDGKPSATYDNRVPNRPWLHANAGADYRFDNIFTKSDNLRLAVDYQWVRWYYLTWEAYGYAETKARIPEQHVVDASATYSFAGGRYNVTLGCNNLFDHTVYDNYKLQKPGRYVFAKFRIFIQ